MPKQSSVNWMVLEWARATIFAREFLPYIHTPRVYELKTAWMEWPICTPSSSTVVDVFVVVLFTGQSTTRFCVANNCFFSLVHSLFLFFYAIHLCIIRLFACVCNANVYYVLICIIEALNLASKTQSQVLVCLLCSFFFLWQILPFMLFYIFLPARPGCGFFFQCNLPIFSRKSIHLLAVFRLVWYY